jgi:tRNA-splicing ligase RtcB
VENHHNFAWKERHVIDGVARDVVVHRKGATPAGAGVLGIIPGSMASPGYLVRGKGGADSLNSASHGAGRVMSRTKAIETFEWSKVNRLLRDRGVHLISAGLDEVRWFTRTSTGDVGAAGFGGGAGAVRSEAGEDGTERRAAGGLSEDD